MALEQLGLGMSGVDGGEGVKTARLPRWTRQEILVLIQGKRVAENRVRRGRASVKMEPKWASVSSYCRRHGVNRGPVQCRKRWSNLAGDYKKIKEWESRIKEGTESYWVMRNDVRRERKLPGFFDKEVYDIVDGGVIPLLEPALALALAPTAATSPDKFNSPPGGGEAKHPEAGSSTSQEHRNCKRKPAGGDDDESNRLIEILERNGQLLAAQLELQNSNFKLDREQRKDQGESLVAVLNKLADAVAKIADKL